MILLSACNHTTEKGEYTSLTRDHLQLQQQNDRLTERIGRLEQERLQQEEKLAAVQSRLVSAQLANLAKQAEINQLILTQENSIQEVVRAQAKLRSRSSRAESVASMAEATMMIKQADRLSTEENQRNLVDRAEQMMGLSKRALSEDNFDGAAFLASQAMALVQPIKQQTVSVSSDDGRLEETLFAAPLPMTVRTRSNVRRHPSLDAGVTHRLDEKSRVEALGYSGEWIQVRVEGGEIGWVYYELLGSD